MKIKKNLIITIEVILLIIIAYSGYKIFSYQKANREFQITHSSLREDVEKLKSFENRENFEVNEIMKLKESYPNIVEWIKIEGTDIDFPVVQGNDNGFYLNHNYKGEQHPFGEVFMDARNNFDFSSQNTIIYGHNVRGHIFHDLEKFKDQKFANKYNHIEIKTLQGILNYKIVAVYPASVDDDYRNPNYSEEEWEIFRDWVSERNLLNSELPENNEQILTLSTCSGDKDRLAIHAKILK